jgi:hypothetical protein
VDTPHGIQSLLKIPLSQSKLLFGKPPVVEDLSYFVTGDRVVHPNTSMKPCCEEDPGQEKGEIAVSQILFPVPEIVEALEACKKPVLGLHKGCENITGIRQKGQGQQICFDKSDLACRNLIEFLLTVRAEPVPVTELFLDDRPAMLQEPSLGLLPEHVLQGKEGNEHLQGLVKVAVHEIEIRRRPGACLVDLLVREQDSLQKDTVCQSKGSKVFHCYRRKRTDEEKRVVVERGEPYVSIVLRGFPRFPGSGWLAKGCGRAAEPVHALVPKGSHPACHPLGLVVQDPKGCLRYFRNGTAAHDKEPLLL